jgi:hypothetical protein
LRIGLWGRMVSSHVSLMGLLLLLLLIMRLSHRGRLLRRIGRGGSIWVWRGCGRRSNVSAVLVAAGLWLMLLLSLWRLLLDLRLLLVRLLGLVGLMRRLLLHRRSLLRSRLVWLILLLLDRRPLLLQMLLRGTLHAVLTLEGLDSRRCLVGDS